MKKFLLAVAACSMVIPMAAAAPKTPKAKADTASFKFTDVKLVKTNPVRDQNSSGTCWSFSTTTFLEDEILRKGGPSVDLSDMFSVRHVYNGKADKFMRLNGMGNFGQGGAAEDVIWVLRNYGLMPEEAYNGLNYGEKKHVHGELANGMAAFLKAINANPNRKLSTAWKEALNGIMDAYLGKLPETFTYNGKTYTPKTFAQELGLNPDDYVSITSYNHHPFYTKFALEIPDNWQWAESNNVPLEDMKAIVDNALENGYPVAWGADVSEGGFKWNKGFAILPAAVDEKNLEGTELSRWVKLSDGERARKRYEVNGPGQLKEEKVTQESRQLGFDNRQTTDDHGMVLVGKAVDQAGNKYYKVQNSWDDNQIYGGFFYVSEPYFLAKTMTIMVNKEAIPAEIAKKMK